MAIRAQLQPLILCLVLHIEFKMNCHALTVHFTLQLYKSYSMHSSITILQVTGSHGYWNDAYSVVNSAFSSNVERQQNDSTPILR